MEELKLFQSPIFGQVRTVVINGQVMFAATDVAKCLGYANPRDAISKHCKSDGVAFCDGVVKTGQRKDGTIYEQTGEIKIITKGNLIRLKLNNKLKELGIQFKQSGQWLLKSPYDKWGMHETRTNIFTSERGNTHTNTYTVWTQKGRRFIIALYENDWDVKKAIKQIKGELEPAA